MDFKLLIVFLGVLLQETPPGTSEVQQLIKTITPTPVGQVRRGMKYRVVESRMYESRRSAISRLGELGPQAAPAVPVLAKLVLDPYEPQRFKLAEIELLRKIGPPAIRSKQALQSIADAEDAVLANAAELALFHIDIPATQHELNQKLETLYSQSRATTDEQRRLMILVNKYIRNADKPEREQAFADIDKSLSSMRRRAYFIEKLVNSEVGKDLGERLLTESKIDGRMVARELLIHSGRPENAISFLEYLGSNDLILQQWLTDPSVPPAAWRRTLASLFQQWTALQAEPIRQQKIAKTARTIISSIPKQQASRFLAESTSSSQSLQFVTQLITYHSEDERARMAERLAELTASNQFDSKALGELLLASVKRDDREPKLPLSPANTFLASGMFAEGERVMLNRLEEAPDDDEARFGLGAIQFALAFERLGKNLYKHGARSSWFPLPIPENDAPIPISYDLFGKMLDDFSHAVEKTEQSLAEIKDDNVQLRLELARVSFDFTGTGRQTSTLLEMASLINRRPFQFEILNPDLRIHFDRGDVAWLRAYCHLLAAMIDFYQAFDLESEFYQWAQLVFPRVERNTEKPNPAADRASFDIVIAKPKKLAEMRLHLLAVCELNAETWRFIRQETDDDYEWLAHPQQSDQLGLPLTYNWIDNWLSMMEDLAAVLKGERLMTDLYLGRFHVVPQQNGQAINLRKILDDPPVGLLNEAEFYKVGVEKGYFEALGTQGATSFPNLIMGVTPMLHGPFGFVQAVRLN